MTTPDKNITLHYSLTFRVPGDVTEYVTIFALGLKADMVCSCGIVAEPHPGGLCRHMTEVEQGIQNGSLAEPVAVLTALQHNLDLVSRMTPLMQINQDALSGSE